MFFEAALKKLQERTGGQGVSIWTCEASNPEDVVMIHDKARALMARECMTSEQFHAKLNGNIFDLLQRTSQEVASEKLPWCQGPRPAPEPRAARNRGIPRGFLEKALWNAPGLACHTLGHSAREAPAWGISENPQQRCQTPPFPPSI